MKELKNEDNPFLDTHGLKLFNLKTTYNVTKTEQVVEGQQNIVLEYDSVTKSRYIEQQKHIKIYDTTNDHIWMFKEFTPTARDLYLYIVFKLQKNLSFIRLSYELLYKATGMAKNSYYNSLKLLIKKKILYKANSKYYWVNPYFIFRGDRKNFYLKHKPDSVEYL